MILAHILYIVLYNATCLIFCLFTSHRNAQYKAFLCTLLDPKVVGAAAASDAATNTSGFTIAGFSEHHTENTVRFRVSLSPDQVRLQLNLQTKISLCNFNSLTFN